MSLSKTSLKYAALLCLGLAPWCTPVHAEEASAAVEQSAEAEDVL